MITRVAKLPQGYVSIAEAARQTEYSIDRLRDLLDENGIDAVRHQNRIYVAEYECERLKPPKKHITLETLSESTGYSVTYLRLLVRKGEITGVKLRGRFYVPDTLADKLGVPEDHVGLEEASRITGYTEGGLYRMIQDNRLTSRIHKQRVYVSKVDLEPLTLPRGFISLEEAAKMSNYSIDWLRDLAHNGTVESVRHRGMLYLSESDVVKYVETPEGFITIKEANRIFGRSETGIRALARRGHVNVVKKGGQVLVSKSSMKNYIDGFCPIDQMSRELVRQEESKRKRSASLILDLYDELEPNHDSPKEIAMDVLTNLNGQRDDWTADAILRLIKVREQQFSATL